MTQNDAGHGSEIRWNDWSKEVFEDARKSGRLVLLDLTASWCHWCHVMDSTTYSVPEVARLVNDNFVPVRVDIDRRPDVSERYNRGGFPTTAFLSDRGESVWGTTYVPPEDMVRIIGSILKAKASGEIDEALRREREPFLDVDAGRGREKLVGSDDVSDAFEDILAAYDVEHGGFGTEPKFPHPDAVDLVLHRYSLTDDPELAEVARHTIESMADGLLDLVESGVFRYSVTRDWHTPHYEKMLETNAGFLRNCARAHVILGDNRFAELAEDVARYILTTLRDHETGGLFGSQDANEKYYRSAAKDRTKRTPPSVDRTVYAGWDSEAAAALVESGVLLGQESWVEAGRAAADFARTHLWNPERQLVRHTEGQELYMFEDQVAFMSVLLELIQLSPDSDLLTVADALVEGVDANFAHPEGGYGDVVKEEDDVGELQTPRRSLITNAKWARITALYGAAVHRPALTDRAAGMLASFPGEALEAYGVFSAAYVTAWTALRAGTASVEIHARAGSGPDDVPLWLEARRTLDPSIVTLRPNVAGSATKGNHKDHATLCTSSGCSEKITEPSDLVRRIRSRWPEAKGQV